MSCAGSATSSEKVAEILKTLKEDSQIDYYEVVTILNLDTQQIAPDFDDSSPPLKKNSRNLKPGYTSNFLLEMAMQFQQIIALPSQHVQICV